MKQKTDMREYPWGLTESEADSLITLVATRGYGTVLECLSDCAWDNGEAEISDSLAEAAAKLAEYDWYMERAARLRRVQQ